MLTIMVISDMTQRIKPFGIGHWSWIRVWGSWGSQFAVLKRFQQQHSWLNTTGKLLLSKNEIQPREDDTLDRWISLKNIKRTCNRSVRYSAYLQQSLNSGTVLDDWKFVNIINCLSKWSLAITGQYPWPAFAANYSNSRKIVCSNLMDNYFESKVINIDWYATRM